MGVDGWVLLLGTSFLMGGGPTSVTEEKSVFPDEPEAVVMEDWGDVSNLTRGQVPRGVLPMQARA